MSTCDTEINETMTIDEIRKKYAEISKLYQRVNRHGDTVVQKVGRKPVTAEHKKAVYAAWIEKRKLERAQKALEEGRVYARGRPRKIQTSVVITQPTLD
jgi:hypothetical protein